MVASKDMLPQSTERIVEVQGSSDSIGRAIEEIGRCLLEDWERGVGTVLFHPGAGDERSGRRTCLDVESEGREPRSARQVNQRVWYSVRTRLLLGGSEGSALGAGGHGDQMCSGGRMDWWWSGRVLAGQRDPRRGIYRRVQSGSWEADVPGSMRDSYRV